MKPTLSRLLPLIMAMVTCVLAMDETTLRLADTWRFQLDGENAGIGRNWHTRKLVDTVQLPGTSDRNRKGENWKTRPRTGSCVSGRGSALHGISAR